MSSLVLWTLIHTLPEPAMPLLNHFPHQNKRQSKALMLKKNMEKYTIATVRLGEMVLNTLFVDNNYYTICMLISVINIYNKNLITNEGCKGLI